MSQFPPYSQPGQPGGNYPLGSFPSPGAPPSSYPAPGVNPFGDAAAGKGQPGGMNVNPYAPPQNFAGYQPQQQPGATQGLWRQGNILVMHKMAPLPPICVKSGQPATQWLKRNLRWHPQWIIALILIHIFVYAIVAMIMQKTATIHIGLTDEWMARRKTRLMIAWLLGLGSVAIGVLSVVIAVNLDEPGYLFLLMLAVFVLLGALIYGQYACSLVRPQRITDQYVFLKGVHPDFLARLPEWTYLQI